MMMTGGTIIFTAIISKLLLKTRIERHHSLGCFFSLIGFVIVGYAGILNSAATSKPGDDSSTKNLIIGIVLNTIYLLVVSLQAVVEELLLWRFPIDVQRMVGLEGLYGLIWSFLLVLGCGYVTCPNPSMCNVKPNFEEIGRFLSFHSIFLIE